MSKYEVVVKRFALITKILVYYIKLLASKCSYLINSLYSYILVEKRFTVEECDAHAADSYSNAHSTKITQQSKVRK